MIGLAPLTAGHRALDWPTCKVIRIETGAANISTTDAKANRHCFTHLDVLSFRPEGRPTPSARNCRHGGDVSPCDEGGRSDDESRRTPDRKFHHGRVAALLPLLTQVVLFVGAILDLVAK